MPAEPKNTHVVTRPICGEFLERSTVYEDESISPRTIFAMRSDKTRAWDPSSVKQRHFIVCGSILKLFGREGRTFKGSIDLSKVASLHYTTDPAAPAAALQMEVRDGKCKSVYLLSPYSEADRNRLLIALGSTVPISAISDELRYFRPRRAPHEPTFASAASISEYKIGKTLGIGSFGKVKLATHSHTGQSIAVKCIDRSKVMQSNQGDRLAKEIQILKMVKHPNVIQLHEVVHTPREIVMMMEYVAGGDLLELINSKCIFSETQVRGIFKQVCAAVEFCHSLGIVHRDLKPENVLIESSTKRVKVADFGMSTLMDVGAFLKTACGSPHYVAPEILNFAGDTSYNGTESDVWSLGVMLYTLLCGQLPFEADSAQQLFIKIKRGLSKLPQHLSDTAKDLISKMLVTDPDKRLHCCEVLQHPWMLVGAAQQVVALSPALNAVLEYNTQPHGAHEVVTVQQTGRLNQSKSDSNLHRLEQIVMS